MNLKLVLVVAAVLIALATLYYALQLTRPKGEVLSQRVKEVQGVKVYELEWSPGVFQGYKLVNDTPEPYDLKAKYYVKAFIPREGKRLLVLAVHTERRVRGFDERGLAQISKRMGVEILVYGEKEEDWREMGYKDRNHLMMMHMLLTARGEGRGHYGLWLGEVMSKAITLGLDLASKEGLKIEVVGVHGTSKEGLAVWLVSTWDDRVEVAIPGNYRAESFQDFLKEAIREWGCKNPNKMWSLVPYYPHPDVLMALNTSLKVEDVISRIDYLKPKFLLIMGDVDTSETHDGRLFPLLAENHFLQELEEREINFRYFRRRPGLKVNEAALILGALYYDVFSEKWPKVLWVNHTLDGDNLTVEAGVKGAQSVNLILGSSSDPAWNDGDERWASIPMKGKDIYRASVKVNLTKFLVIYVEASTRGEMSLVDSSPYEVVNWPYSRTCERPDYETIKGLRITRA